MRHKLHDPYDMIHLMIKNYPFHRVRLSLLLLEFQEVLAELAKDKSMDAFRGEYEKLFNFLEKSNRNEKRLR